MTQWWNKLSSRERGLITLAVAILGAFLLLQLIVAPALKTRTAKRIDAARAARTLDVISNQAPPRNGAVNSQKPAELDPDGFRRAILDTANNRGLIITRVQMGDNGVVAVQLGDTSAQAVFAWLFDLKRTVGVEVSRATISDIGSGMVRSSFEFGGETAQ